MATRARAKVNGNGGGVDGVDGVDGVGIVQDPADLADRLSAAAGLKRERGAVAEGARSRLAHVERAIAKHERQAAAAADALPGLKAERDRAAVEAARAAEELQAAVDALADLETERAALLAAESARQAADQRRADGLRRLETR